jgi:hypothetical protein
MPAGFDRNSQICFHKAIVTSRVTKTHHARVSAQSAAQ